MAEDNSGPVSKMMGDDTCPTCGGNGKRRTYTAEEQVKGGTEYQAEPSTEAYMRKYGGDVSKWPYKNKK